MSGITIQDLHYDVLGNVFNFLDPKSLAKASLVCKQWKKLSSEDRLWRGHDLTKLFPALSVVGKSYWELRVDVKKHGLSFEGEALIDQRNIICKIHQMFKTLSIQNNAGITLLTMPEGLAFQTVLGAGKSPMQGYKRVYFCIDRKIPIKFCSDPVKKTYLVAMTNNILTKSRALSPDDQRTFVKQYGCSIPSVLETIALSFLTQSQPINLSTSPHKFAPSIARRCLHPDGSFYIIGNISTGGLFVHPSPNEIFHSGVEAMQIFEAADSK